MGLIDFKEVPSSRGGQAGQDVWVLFAREFFAALNIDIEEGPDRGPDSGRDLIIAEVRKGVLGFRRHKWLISCKHFAHSNKSVSVRDEPDILGRVKRFEADGFIGFYSTLPSAELNRTIQTCKKEIDVSVYDAALIERNLLNNPNLNGVFERFFPHSYREYKKISPALYEISESVVGISCNVCGKDLFKEREGRIGYVEKLIDKDKRIHIVDMYWACIGDCDRQLEYAFEKRGFLTAWEGIEDLMIPLIFIKEVITTMNSLRSGNLSFSDTAYEKFKELTFSIAQLVVRETSDEEKQRIQMLRDMPQVLGGLGQWGLKA